MVDSVDESLTLDEELREIGRDRILSTLRDLMDSRPVRGFRENEMWEAIRNLKKKTQKRRNKRKKQNLEAEKLNLGTTFPGSRSIEGPK